MRADPVQDLFSCVSKGVCPRSCPRAMASTRSAFEIQSLCNGPGDLRYFQSMGQSGSCNGLPEPPEKPGSYPSSSEKICCGGSGPCLSGKQSGYHILSLLFPFPGIFAEGGIRAEIFQFLCFQLFTNIHPPSLTFFYQRLCKSSPSDKYITVFGRFPSFLFKKIPTNVEF